MMNLVIERQTGLEDSYTIVCFKEEENLQKYMQENSHFYECKECSLEVAYDLFKRGLIQDFDKGHNWTVDEFSYVLSFEEYDDPSLTLQ